MRRVQTNKCKNGKFKFKYDPTEYDILLKKHDDDVSKLNKALTQKVSDFIQENKKTDFKKVRKGIYVGGKLSEDISMFCSKKNLSQSELSELVKRQFFL